MRTFLLSHDGQVAIPVYQILRLEINHSTLNFGVMNRPNWKDVYRIDAVTKDGEKVAILDNIKSLDEAREALKQYT